MENFLQFRSEQARLVRRTRQISDPVILYRGLSGASIAETAILVNDGHLLYRSRPLECWTFSKDQACEFVVSQTHESRRTYDGVIIEAVFNIDDVWIWHDNDLGGEDQVVLGPIELVEIQTVYSERKCADTKCTIRRLPS